MAVLQASCLIAFALLLVAAGWQDLRTMRIANALPLAVVAVFAIWAVIGLAAGTLTVTDIAWALACAIGLFLAGAVVFAVGAMGGGDVKLAAAAGLFAGPSLLPDFLTITALVGGLLGLAIVAGAPVSPAISASAGGTVRARLRGGLPYGPAIAAGGLWVAASLGCA